MGHLALVADGATYGREPTVSVKSLSYRGVVHMGLDVAKDAMEVLVASQESFLAGGAATIPYRMIYLATFVRVIR